MSFASIFVPNFTVQAVMRPEPDLRGRALALLEGAASTRTVTGVNEAVAKAGVRIGMTKSQAEQFGEIQFRERSQTQERIAHAALQDLGWSVSPRIESAAADTLALDIAGLASLFGSEENIARRLAAGAARLGFSTHIATAANLDAAILASRAWAGITVIPRGKEADVIGKASVIHLFPMAPAAEVLETLERWGVHTCAALAALPVLQLSQRLGQEGIRLQDLAAARSPRVMVLAQPAIDFEEELELEDAEAELEPLTFLVGRLLDQLCARLAERSLAAGAIRMRFQLEPAADKQVRRLHDDPSPATPAIYERTLRPAVPLRDSKMLLKLLNLNLQADPPSTPILKIHLAAQAARPRVVQGGLFSPISPDPEKVELTAARLAKLVGDENIGSPELLDTHRPEGFQMRRFVPGGDPAETRRGVRRAPRNQPAAMTEKLENSVVKDFQTAFRVFRPALEARVEVFEGCPARVAFAGMRGRVVAASGPWRASGDWWTENAWQGDEWDVEIESETRGNSRPRESAANPGAKAAPQRGVYRLVYDPARRQWLIRGAYD